ncbi:uncharacterized protein [Argopecten irradians]|uniref:uncharacterized protein n=1 Tax=Argopecten irradians TaxID=31199 RepID=UPI00371F5BD9
MRHSKMSHSYVWLTGLACLVTVLSSTVYGVCQTSTLRGDDYNFLTVLGVRARFAISTNLNEPTEYQFVSSKYKDLWKSTLVTPLPAWLRYNKTTTTVNGTPVEAGVTMVRLDLTHSKMTNTCNSSMASDLTIVVHDSPAVSIDTTDQCSSIDTAPTLDRPIDQLKVQVGRPFLHNICDTFKSVDNLDLSLMLTMPYGKDVPSNFWLQIDESVKYLYGLPLTSDTKVTDSVTLVAMDTCAQKSRDAIHLDFEPLPEVTHNLTLTVTPATRTNGDDAVLLVHLVSKLETWFDSIQEQADVYVVVIEWKGDQLIVKFTLSGPSFNTCSKPYIENLVKDMTLPAFTCLLAPMFTLEGKVSVSFSGNCVNTYPDSTVPSKYGMSKMKPTLDHWLEVVVPCAAFLLIVTIVVIVLMACGKSPRRRKRYVLKSEIPTYLEDRKPIIFPDETRRKDTSLEPRAPILIPGNGEYEPWQQNDGENGSLPLLRGTPDRTAPTPPEYLLNDIGVPPPYRLPPPYNSAHPTW